MTYYIFLENGNLNGCGQCKIMNDEVENLVVTEELYNLYQKTPNKYIYLDGEIVENPNYEAEEAQKERERLDMLSLTAADVERAIYKDKGIDFEDVIEMVRGIEVQRTSNVSTESNTSNPPALQPSIDIKALKIELKANNFYRGNPYINQIGALLGYTSDDLDYLFENKELPIKEVEEDNSAGEASGETSSNPPVDNNEVEE